MSLDYNYIITSIDLLYSYKTYACSKIVTSHETK